MEKLIDHSSTKYKLEISMLEVAKKSFPDANIEEVLIEYPKEKAHGDYACNIAMHLSGVLKKKPRDIAETIIKNFEKPDYLEKIEIAGPGFINFWLSYSFLSKNIDNILKQNDKYGSSQIGKNEKVMVEYSSPNTNKPLHVGHIRNNCIGMSLSNILKFIGYDVLKSCIVNDRGIHICKSMLAYKLFSKNETPESSGIKGDHLIGDYYVLYNEKLKEDPSMEDRAREMLLKLEAGDKETVELWEKLNSWVSKGFNETYEKIGSKFDIQDYESKIYKKGKEVILKALKDGVCEKIEGGAVAIDLSKYNLGDKEHGKKVLIRSDGTSMYITQDIYLAVKRAEEYGLNKIIYVVADEQIYHFQVLFKILELFGYKWANKCYHLHYGMVNLPEGKMKSREGTVVDADDLISELEKMAQEAIKERHKDISEENLKNLAEKIALSAIKYHILKMNHESEMIYDPKKSLDFEGDTGPYLQYANARICSILAKAKLEDSFDSSLLKEVAEISLMRKLAFFPETVISSGSSYKPHEVAYYLYYLAQEFNTFYAKVPVLKAEGQLLQARLHLIKAVSIVLKTGLKLLGIDAVEKM